MRFRTHFVAASILAALLPGPSPALAAEPAPIGDEFLAGNLFFPAEEEWQLCRAADGSTNRVVYTSDNIHAPGRQVFVERTDAGGNALPSIQLDPKSWSAGIRCTDAGTFLVAVWFESVPELLQQVRTFDAAGNEIGSFITAAQYWWGRSIGLHDTAGIYVTRWEGGEAQVLFGQWLDYDGEPRSDAVELGAVSHTNSDYRGVAVDTAGNVLVAWIANGAGDAPVGARMVDVGGHVLGPLLWVSEVAPPYLWDLIVRVEAEGLFTVYWLTDFHGGRVGRSVSIDPDSVRPPTVTTTTLPAFDDGLEFSPGQQVGRESIESGRADRNILVGDGAGTWLLGWWQAVWNSEVGSYADYAFTLGRSVDNGRHWTPTSLDQDGGESIAMDSDGSAMISGRGSDASVRVRLSSNGGRSWERDATIETPVDRSLENVWYGTAGSWVATDGAGTWGVAWAVEEVSDGGQSRAMLVFVSLSYDNGQSWQDAQQLWRGPGERRAEVRIDASTSGNWVVAWQTTLQHAVWTSRSITNGVSWDAASLAVQLDPVESEYTDWTWRNSLNLEHVGGNRWLLAFASRYYQTADYGSDGDIFFMRSANDGATWSAPLALNAYARVDGATDDSPSLDSNAAGETMILWKSHEALGGTLGFDADILRSTSSDAGASWTWPVAANAGAGSDTSPQIFPALAAGADGSWLAAWHTYDQFGSWAEQDHSLMVAAAPFHCGDGALDAAEACDDGNDAAGDGCDPNCTTTACGNGILNDGEECDDGNDLADDACTHGCRAARCGDGVLQPFVEECDTAATTYDGECLPTCQWATCGDGYLQAGWEQCEDANDDDSDGCTAWCFLAYCGDGYVWTGHEECDEGGDDDNDDACVDGCKLATCGDGFLRKGVEDCEPSEPVPFHPCQSDCRFLPSCGEAGSEPHYTATGALTVLRLAVGLESSCGLLVCDMDANGRVTVIDALMVLKVAVGERSYSVCISSVEVAIFLDDPRTFGSLDFDVTYSPQLGTFRDGNGSADCRGPSSGVFAAANALPTGLLRAGMISLAGVAGPAEIMTCTFRFSHRSPPTAADFTLAYRQGTDVHGVPLAADSFAHVVLR